MSYPHPEQTPTGWEPPTGAPSGVGQPPPSPPPPPAAPAQPPGYLDGPPVRPGRRRRWPWIVLGVFVLLLLAVGGCSWLVLQAARPPVDAANRWLALVDEGRWDEAYDEACAAVKSRATAEEAEASLIADFGAGIDAYTINRYQNTNGAVSVGGKVTVGGDQRPIAIDMVDSAEGWRVCGYGFTSLDVGGSA